MEEEIRGYYISHKAYYSHVIENPEVVFGMYVLEDNHDHGTMGEMNIVWEMLNDQRVPCLHCFDDAWKVLNSFGDVLAKMAEVDNMTIQPEDFVKILDECGFKDLTKYKIPYES